MIKNPQISLIKKMYIHSMIVQSNIFCLIFKNTNRFLFHIYSVSISCRIWTNEYGRAKFEVGFARHEEKAREREKKKKTMTELMVKHILVFLNLVPIVSCQSDSYKLREIIRVIPVDG